MVLIYNKQKETIFSKYTKNIILNVFESDTVCGYDYKKINGKEYIFLENKDEDYVYTNKMNGYYVLEKIGGNFMELVFEKKQKIYSVLTEEKSGLLLGKNIYLPSNKRGNINTLIVGGSGSGKSASYILPNILNMLGSYVITDPLGELYEKSHEYLEKNGYEVITVNYEKSKNDYKYNPFDHLNGDKDIDILADIIIGKSDSDEFWSEASKCLIKSIIYYIVEKEEKKDLLTCFNLLGMGKDELFKKFEECDNGSKVRKYASILKTFPEKTYYSVVSTAITKLSFVINKISDDRNYEKKFDFKELNERKLAIFIVFKDNYKEDIKIANIFISQILSQLNIDDKNKQDIFFILDQFGTLGHINDFVGQILNSRARRISFSLILSTIDNLKNVYGNEIYTILNTIDSQLLLGTNIKQDIDYFSESFGLDYEFIKNDLDNDKLLIFEKGLKPILAEKDYFFKHEEWVKL